jgi:hypothetical protein
VIFKLSLSSVEKDSANKLFAECRKQNTRQRASLPSAFFY